MGRRDPVRPDREPDPLSRPVRPGSRSPRETGPPRIAVRRARADEAGTLTDVARAAKASWSYPAAWLEAWSPQLTFTADYVRRHAVYVAEVDGAIAGVAALEGAEVAHLWVRPDRQGGGVGRALLERLVEQARERGWTELRVVSDPNARPFYERFGAVLVDEVPAPVAGVDRKLPVLDLPVRRRRRSAEPTPRRGGSLSTDRDGFGDRSSPGTAGPPEVSSSHANRVDLHAPAGCDIIAGNETPPRPPGASIVHAKGRPGLHGSGTR